MDLTVGSWFSEPKIYFKIPNQVDLYIRKQIKQYVMKPLGLLDSYPGKFLHLTETTNKAQTILEVKLGRKWRKTSTSRNVALWFPYYKIINSEYPLKMYLHTYIECLPIIFKEWGVTKEQIENVKTKSEDEILNNPNYELTDEEIKEYEEEDVFNDKMREKFG